jgi:hypothetical protein
MRRLLSPVSLSQPLLASFFRRTLAVCELREYQYDCINATCSAGLQFETVIKEIEGHKSFAYHLKGITACVLQFIFIVIFDMSFPVAYENLYVHNFETM